MQIKPALRVFLKDQFILYDGAMGTLLSDKSAVLKHQEYHKNCLDSLYLGHSNLIEDIHRLYLESGAAVIETNTFSSNPFKLHEYNLQDKVTEINRIAVETASRLAEEYWKKTNKPRYVALSTGPSGYLISSDESSLNAISCRELFEGYCAQLEPAILAGVDIILIETGQDLLETQVIARAALHLKKKLQKDNLFIQVQVTLDENGKMVLGSDITAVLAALEPFPIDALGINCSTGPAEMEPALAYLSYNSRFFISCLPNAGIPVNVEGKAVYDLGPADYADQFSKLIRKYNIEIAGGCCGTTPGHIKTLALALDNYSPARQKPQYIPRLSSQFTAQTVKNLSRPVIIGERLNVQGSKKTRSLLVNEEYRDLIDIAREQVSQGVYMLDICTANNIVGNEVQLMEKLTAAIQANIDASLVIDSTEEDVLQKVIPKIIGRGIINSINLEGGEEKARRILELAREYGFMVIALAIDENGMAGTAGDKFNVAQKIIRLIDSMDFPRNSLLFDPLVFSLATGTEQYQNSAVETLHVIQEIKKTCPEINISLGISNISFGLMPQARKYLNTVFLEEAAQKGLDFAIFNPDHLRLLSKIPPSVRKKSLDLIYNRHAHSLEAFIQEFETLETAGVSASRKTTSPETLLKSAILQRKRRNIDTLIEDNLQQRDAKSIIHDILLPAMEEVGEKMSTGEIILPYVLQSAEIFKIILDKLAPHFPRDEDTTKKKVLLATVYGDIHDIGKNLVRTLLENSGFKVFDLGKQVSSNTIVEKARQWRPDIIGLSALLVTTSRYMADCVQKLHENALNIPVLIGGAAVNEQFAEKIRNLKDDTLYAGGVYYAQDAFQGIKKIEKILQGRDRS